MATATLARTAGQNLESIRRRENFFFSGMALLILTTVLVGFARTYFLAGLFRAPLPSLMVHIHGAVFSTWILLLVVQVSLVSAGRVDLHRRLGLAAFALASLMPLVGLLAATDSLRRNFSPPGSGLDPKTFYAIPVADMVIFAGLMLFAYRARTNPPAHKRLILLSTIALMDAPTGRPPFAAITARPHLDVVFCWLFLLLLIACDLWSKGKVHRATIFGGLAMVLVEQVRLPLGMTPAWHAWAAWAQALGHP
jgi:hypothetical protein